jgi:hypothetical protein
LISKGDPDFAGTIETVVSSAGASVAADASVATVTGASVAGAAVGTAGLAPHAVNMMLAIMKTARRMESDFFI